MSSLPCEPKDRVARRAHAILLCALALGIAAWLFRTYGFKPLRFNAGPGEIAP